MTGYYSNSMDHSEFRSSASSFVNVLVVFSSDFPLILQLRVSWTPNSQQTVLLGFAYGHRFRA